MATTPIPAPEAQATISPFGRVIGVLFSPGKTFEDIVRKPSWLLPVVIVTALSIVSTFAFARRVNWREVVGQQIEKSPRASQLSAEQKEQQVEAGAKFAPIITEVAGVCAPTLLVLVIGLVMWGAYSLLGGASTNFSTALGITSHSFLPGIVSTPLFLLILYLKDPSTIDVENPMATNIAALLAEDSAKWLVALGKSFDIFTFWTLILLAIGFAATSPKKLKGAKPYVIAFGVWAAFVVVRVGIAFILS